MESFVIARQLANMSSDEILDLTADVFVFLNIAEPIYEPLPYRIMILTGGGGHIL